MKLGNYGTGRGYRYYTTSSGSFNNPKDLKLCVIFLSIIMTIGLGTFIYFEYDISQKLQAVKEISYQVYPNIPAGQQGIEHIKNYGLQGKVVHLQGVNITSEAINDRSFGFDFQNTLGVKRNTEYCQWQEIRHENRRAVGKDSNNQTIYEVDVHFSYVLGWHSSLINSLFFNSAISYHNPQRNPIPSQQYFTRASLGNSIKVDTKHLADSPSSQYQQYYIPFNATVADYAYHNGFTVTTDDGKWAYSQYQEDYGFLKKATGFLLEGVLDLGIKGTCTPGDIRVGFTVDQLPETYSIIGVYKDRTIDPVKLSNGYQMILGLEGYQSVQEIESAYTDQYKNWRMWYRLGFMLFAGIMTLIFFCVGGQRIFKNQENTKTKEI